MSEIFKCQGCKKSICSSSCTYTHDKVCIEKIEFYAQALKENRAKIAAQGVKPTKLERC